MASHRPMICIQCDYPMTARLVCTRCGRQGRVMASPFTNAQRGPRNIGTRELESIVPSTSHLSVPVCTRPVDWYFGDGDWTPPNPVSKKPSNPTQKIKIWWSEGENAVRVQWPDVPTCNYCKGLR